MSSRFPKSQAVCPHRQLLREKAQRFKFVVETVEFPTENFFVMLLFLLQRGNLVDPPLHDAGAAAATLDEIVGLLLIQRDLLLDVSNVSTLSMCCRGMKYRCPVELTLVASSIRR